ncbi:WD repeat-containing 3, partial [Brachionus plicatilis]
MGLTKQYLRYAATNIFGVIATSRSNIRLIKFKGTTGKYAAVAACEYVFIWDLKKSECVLKLTSDKPSEVTCIEQDENNINRLAVGYLDGSIRVFDLKQKPAYANDYGTQLSLDQECINSYLTFNGHKTAITTLNFDSNGVRLVSGSKDTDIVLWDLVGECGLFRLKGHKSPVTRAIFMTKRNLLITSAKDMLVKFWDLDTRHCFKTIVSHRSEVNDLMLLNEDSRLITGCHDNELRVFELSYTDVEKEPGQNEEPNLKKLKINDDESDEMEEDSLSSVLDCKLIGSLIRESKDPLTQLRVDPAMNVFSSHSANEKHLELYKIHSDEEIKKRLAKKLKKQKRKVVNSELAESTADSEMASIEKTVSDEFTKVCMLKTKHNIKYVDLFCEMPSEKKRLVKSKDADDQNEEYLFDCKIGCLLQNNMIEVYSCKVTKKVNSLHTASLMYALEMPGHRTDVRTLAFSSDSTAFITASGDSMKVWNRMSLSCIRTFKCDYALSSLFLYDDNHVLIGTKSGKIQLFNINLACMLENVIAHDDDTAVWSLALVPDKTGFVSAGADKTVRFWNFELVDDEESKTKKRLSFIHQKTLKLDDDVLCIKISPNGKLIAVALLDTTVKVFFMDSLKLFLNLYGHKQPVLSMDISFDNRLIVTGSADRHLKIWGLDFGDCHRSLFAHEDSIMSVQFVGKTHYVFTVGKDGKLKEWDADKFERIITLNGHLAEVWALSVSDDGKYVLTASHDKSVRLWQKTNELLVLEDERENEKEQQYENEIPKEEQVIAGESNKETGLATIKTIETLKSAEKIIESINIFLEEENKLKIYQDAIDKCSSQEEKDKIKIDPKHPLLVALNDVGAEDYVLQTLKKTKSSEIETTLLVLEFEYVKILLQLLCKFIKESKQIELCIRCALFLLKINYGQITTTQSLLPLIEQLRAICYKQGSEIRDTVGFNLSAVKFLKQKVEENDQIRLFSDVSS